MKLNVISIEYRAAATVIFSDMMSTFYMYSFEKTKNKETGNSPNVIPLMYMPISVSMTPNITRIQYPFPVLKMYIFCR